MHTQNSTKNNDALRERRVSRKFQAYITNRVEESCRFLPDGDDICAEALRLINSYISEGTLNTKGERTEVMLIIGLLRPEIDKAVSRSIAARRRAAARKQTAERTEHAAVREPVQDTSEEMEEICLPTASESPKAASMSDRPRQRPIKFVKSRTVKRQKPSRR